MKLIKHKAYVTISTKNFNWKLEADIANIFREFLFEKNPQNLQKMYELINVLPPSNVTVFNCCYFLC